MGRRLCIFFLTFFLSGLGVITIAKPSQLPWAKKIALIIEARFLNIFDKMGTFFKKVSAPQQQN